LAIAVIFVAMIPALAGCGGGSKSGLPPIVLTVSLSNPVIMLPQGGTIYAPVVIMAPTETVSFAISGLPTGVNQSYKESESNPSGLLTLTASTATQAGTYKPTIVVGSSGQTASFVFTLVIAMPAKAGVMRGAASL
jgi:hypothetical protein